MEALSPQWGCFTMELIIGLLTGSTGWLRIRRLANKRLQQTSVQAHELTTLLTQWVPTMTTDCLAKRAITVGHTKLAYERVCLSLTTQPGLLKWCVAQCAGQGTLQRKPEMPKRSSATNVLSSY